MIEHMVYWREQSRRIITCVRVSKGLEFNMAKTVLTLGVRVTVDRPGSPFMTRALKHLSSLIMFSVKFLEAYRRASLSFYLRLEANLTFGLE